MAHGNSAIVRVVMALLVLVGTVHVAKLMLVAVVPILPEIRHQIAELGDHSQKFVAEIVETSNEIRRQIDGLKRRLGL